MMKCHILEKVYKFAVTIFDLLKVYNLAVILCAILEV